MIIWSAEFYENLHDGRAVESWLDSLTEQKFAAMTRQEITVNETKSVKSTWQERALTQRALADLSGVQQADISRMERGILAPTTSTLMRLVEALDGRLVIELIRTDKKKPIAKPLVSTIVTRSV